MGRKVRVIQGYSPQQIKELIEQEPNYKIGMQLCALYQVSLGKSSRELKELFHVSFKQILNWVDRFEKQGVEGLKDKGGRGRKCRLTTDQKQELKRVVLEEFPSHYGYNTNTWTGPIIREWIKNNFGVSYKQAQIYNILRSLGLSYQKGKGKYPEANKEQQEKFKESLKKTARKST